METTLFQALDALYSQHTDPATIRNVNNWLMQFQQSEHCWDMCVSILGGSVRKEEYLLFCSSTLRSKSASDSFEPSLNRANQILSLIKIYATSPYKGVIQHLCTTLCSCLPSDVAVEYIMASFSGGDNISIRLRFICLNALLECMHDTRPVKKHAVVILDSLSSLTIEPEEVSVVMTCARSFMVLARDSVPQVRIYVIFS